MPEHGPLACGENLFGKMRGRFDEETAQRVALADRERCLGALSAMSPENLRALCAAFNSRFERMGRSLRIIEDENSGRSIA